MLGLRVSVDPAEPLVMALGQENYLASASASWRRELARFKPSISFDGSGIDDREDHLRWYRYHSAKSMKVQIVDVEEGTAPRRASRRKVDWHKRLMMQRERDLTELARLELMMRRMKTRIQVRRHEGAVMPPELAFLVTVNGHRLGTVAVNSPGSITVDVILRVRGGRGRVTMNVHGVESDGHRRWGRMWAWSGRPLELGDVAEVEIVPSEGADLGSKSEIPSPVPTSEQEIASAIASLKEQLASDYYKDRAAMMVESDRNRPAPRRYSGASARTKDR